MAEVPDLERGKIPPVLNPTKPEHLVDQQIRKSSTKSRKLEEDADAPYAAHCRPDAEIWRRYLQETEAEDKELAQLWNNSLDSLLVFAGLFAAILTAFLVESRKDLKEDPQEHLLKEIVNILRNASNTATPEPFRPEPSSLHVNGLWFASLTLTLMSALGSVLAKSWLAKFNPASQREQSSDACERHLRVMRAQEWQLEWFITMIPVIIQVSLFLFFAGLVIQISDHDIRIWSTVIILVGSTVLMYIVGTCLPWFSPACPFQTPISGFYVARNTRGRYREVGTNNGKADERPSSWRDRFQLIQKSIGQFLENVQTKPEQLVLEAQILSWAITNSTHEGTVREAIRVVAGSKPTNELRSALVDAGAPETLYQRLQYRVKLVPGLPKSIDNASQVECLLYALLQIEQPPDLYTTVQDTSLPTILLDEGQCLRRWDDFEPQLQALAFSLRVHMLLNRNEDDHDENWIQIVRNLKSMGEAGSPPNIRKILLFATIRGLLSDKLILQRTCAIIISRQIPIANVREDLFTLRGWAQSDTGYVKDSMIHTTHERIAKALAGLCSDVDGNSREGASLALVNLAKYKKLRYCVLSGISELTTAFRLQKSDNLATVASTINALALHGELHQHISDIIPEFVHLLDSALPANRGAAISTIIKLSEHVDFSSAICAAIPQLIENTTALSRPLVPLTPGQANFLTTTLVNLAAHEKAQSSVRDSIPQLIQLLDHQRFDVKSSATLTLNKLCDHKELFDSISDAIPKFLGLLTDFNTSLNAALALAKFAGHDKFRSSILDITPEIMKLLAGPRVTSHVCESLSTKLAEYSEFHGFITSIIPHIIDSFKRQPTSGRQPAKEALVKLADSSTFHQALALGIPKLIQLLEWPGPSVRKATIATIAELAKYSEIRIAIRDTLPRVMELLNSQDKGVVATVVPVFSALGQYEDLQDVIIGALPPLSALIKAQQGDSTAAAISTLVKLYGYATFRSSISDLIPQIIELLQSRDRETLIASISSLAQLGGYAESAELVRSAIPQLIDLLRYPNSSVRSAVASTFAELSNHPTFHEEIRRAIPHLTETLKSSDTLVQSSVISTFSRMAEHAEIRDLIIDVIPQLTEMLRSTWMDPSQSIIVSTLIAFAKHVELQNAIRSVIPSLIKWLKFPEPHTRSASANALAQFVEHAEFYDAFDAAIPTLVGLLEDRSGQIPTPSTISAILFRLSQYPKLCTVVCSTIFHMTVPSFSVKSEGPTLPSFVQYTMIEPHQSLSSQRPILPPSSSASGFHPGITQMWSLLSSKNSQNLQSVMQCLSRQANIFRMFPQTIAGTLGTLIKKASEAQKSRLLELVEHDQLRVGVGSAIPLLFKQPRSIGVTVDSAIFELMKNEKLRNSIRASVKQLTQLALYPDTSDRSAAINVIRRLVVNAELRGAIGPVIPQLVNLLEASESGSRTAAALTLSSMATYTEFHDAIHSAIPIFMELLKDSDRNIQDAATVAVAKLAKRVEFRPAISSAIPHFTDWFKVPPPGYLDTRSSATEISSALVEFAGDAEFCSIILGTLPKLIGFVKNPYNQSLESIIRTLGRLSAFAELREAIRDAVPHLMSLINKPGGSNASISSITSTLVTFAEHVELRDAILGIVPSLVTRLTYRMDMNGPIIGSAVAKLAKHEEIHRSICDNIPKLMQDLELPDINKKMAAAGALSILSKHSIFHDALADLVPQCAQLLKGPNAINQSYAASILVDLKGSDNSYETIDEVIPSIIELLKSIMTNVVSDASALLCYLATCEELRSIICNHVSKLVDLFKDPEFKGRVSLTNVILKLSTYSEFQGALREVIPYLPGMLRSLAMLESANSAKIISALAQNAELHETIGENIPALFAQLEIKNNTQPEQVATAFCSIVEHAPLRSLITEEHSDKLLRLLKDNTPRTRLAASRIVEVLIKYPDTRQLLLKGGSQGFWVERLHDSDIMVLGHVTSIFCYLVVEGHIHQGILPAILDALNSLEDSNVNVSKYGATIIFGMASHARFRDILYEVLSIRAPIRHFMTELSPKDADLFLQKMEYYGLLKEL